MQFSQYVTYITLKSVYVLYKTSLQIVLSCVMAIKSGNYFTTYQKTHYINKIKVLQYNCCQNC